MTRPTRPFTIDHRQVFGNAIAGTNVDRYGSHVAAGGFEGNDLCGQNLVLPEAGNAAELLELFNPGLVVLTRQVCPGEAPRFSASSWSMRSWFELMDVRPSMKSDTGRTTAAEARSIGPRTDCAPERILSSNESSPPRASMVMNVNADSSRTASTMRVRRVSLIS